MEEQGHQLNGMESFCTACPLDLVDVHLNDLEPRQIIVLTSILQLKLIGQSSLYYGSVIHVTQGFLSRLWIC